MDEDKIRYFTRNGTEIKIFDMEAGGDYPILGAYKAGDRWVPRAWMAGGFHSNDGWNQMDIDWTATEIPQESGHGLG